MGQHNDYTKFGKHNKFNLDNKNRNEFNTAEKNIVEKDNNVIEESTIMEEITSNIVDEISTESQNIEYEELQDNEITNLKEDEIIDINKTDILNDSVILGIVNNCTKLNIRELPDKDSNPIGILNEGDIVKINMNESTDQFYKILTKNNISGYCMKEFIKDN